MYAFVMNFQSLQHESWPSNLSGFPRSPRIDAAHHGAGTHAYRSRRRSSCRSCHRCVGTTTNFTKSHTETLLRFGSGLTFLHQGILQSTLSLHHQPELLRELPSCHCPESNQNAPLPCSRITTTIHDTHLFLLGRMAVATDTTLKTLDYTSRFVRAM